MCLTQVNSKLENVPLFPLVAHVTSANGKAQSPNLPLISSMLTMPQHRS